MRISDGCSFTLSRPSKARYGPDLPDDPVIRVVDQMWWAWVVLGLAFPFALGLTLRSILGGLTGLLWVIRGLERLGLASDVVRVEPQRQRTKAVAPAS